MGPRVSVFLAIILLVGSGALNAGPSSLPPVGGVRIESLTHDATKPLIAGDVITVTLRGSAGGTATFHIFGIIADGSMTEVRPGIYQAQPAIYTGRYTVQRGDAIRNAAVFATLKVSDREVVAVSKRSVSIGTDPPGITSLHPAPQAHLTNTRPNIVVRFYDPITGVNPASVRVVVNDKDVTPRASVTDTSASYSPEAPFAPGPVRVQIAIANQVKLVHQAEWTFTIDPSVDLIKSVTINPTTVLNVGDVLTVVMTGAPGGEATFAIQGLQASAPMRESKTPGLYLGTYAAQSRQRIIDAPVVVTLTKAGQLSSTTASVGVTILSGPPPAPTIRPAGTEVALGKRNATKMVFTGRSLPGVRIQGEIAFATTEKLLSAEEQGTLGQFSTMTGTDGNWRNAIGPVMPFHGAKLVVSVVAFDAAGHRSPSSTAEITLP